MLAIVRLADGYYMSHPYLFFLSVSYFWTPTKRVQVLDEREEKRVRTGEYQKFHLIFSNHSSKRQIHNPTQEKMKIFTKLDEKQKRVKSHHFAMGDERRMEEPQLIRILFFRRGTTRELLDRIIVLQFDPPTLANKIRQLIPTIISL